MKDIDQLVLAIRELTNQTARQAFAAETLVKMSLTVETSFATPCPCCGCQLLQIEAQQCPACRTKR